MHNRLVILLLVFLFCSPELFSQEKQKDDRLRSIVNSSGQAAVTIPFPGAREMSVLSHKVSISSVRDKNVEIILSPLTTEWFISGKYDYSIVEPEDMKGILTASSVKQAMEWSAYPTYVQYDSIMQSFQTLYPQLCNVDTIGTTKYGKLVLVLKISDNVLADESEPEVFFTSTIHGDETGGFILMLRLADYLLRNYNTSARVKNMVDNLEIWINPLSNPDGTYRTGNTISSPTRYNANGYDLNRNFHDPVDDDLVRQKETIDMTSFMRDHKFVISSNFHAGEEVVNYPWDRWSRRHPDEDWFYYISRKYADTVHVHAVPGYMTFMENGVTDGYDWYYIYGGRQDFITYELQGREVTIELDNTKLTPAANLNSLWGYNFRSLLGYLENALYGIHGIVTDFTTGQPVAAKVFIEGHDADSSHVYSDASSGNFVRLIAPGSWTLTFSAEGYASKTVNVNVQNNQMTWIEVQMIPVINPVDTAETKNLFLYPNPADTRIKMVLPDRQFGIVDIRLFNSNGVKCLDMVDVHTFEDIPVEIPLSSLTEGFYSIVVSNTATGISDKASFIIIHRK